MSRRGAGVRATVFVVASALAAATGVAGAGAAHADTTSGPAWAPTATGATHLDDATATGTAAASTPLPLTVALRPRDAAGLTALLAAQTDPASPQYHRWITPAQFTAAYGATPTQAASVVAYLRSQGLTDVAVGANRLTVTAEATAGTASRAFATTIGSFQRLGRAVVANTTPARVPADLAAVVSGVVGLDTAARAQTFHTTPRAIIPSGRLSSAAAVAAVTDYPPADFATTYDAASLPAATGTTLAIMAEGDLAPVLQDLSTAESVNGLPVVPETTVPTGPAGTRYTDTSGIEEWDLDTQASTAMAYDVSRLYVYDTPSLDDQDITTELSRFATDDLALVGSASFGLCDSDAQSDGSAAAMDIALQEAQAQGQAFFASSGDTGSGCATGNNQTPNTTQPSYPSSSTYATGVGGTTLSTGTGATYGSETVWNNADGASGGGLSTVEARPSYASAADTSDTADFLLHGSARGVPDMAMDGDPDSGADIIVSGGVRVIGGTSLSSPLAAGAWARMETAHRNNLGLAAPDLYGIYNGQTGDTPIAEATNGLHDVTSGNNGAYSAHTGYDVTTGLGTLDAAAVSAELDVPPSFTADTPPSSTTVGTAYSYTFTAHGSPAPLFTVTSGGLPPGLSLNAGTGVLAGTTTIAGTYTFQVTAANGIGTTTSGTTPITAAEPASGQGDAAYQGSTGNIALNKPIVGMAVDKATGGYWLVASDGGVFAFNAPFYGSAGALALKQPIVGMAATPDGGGYYLVAADGGIFNYGDAHFQGSTGNIALARPVVGMAVDAETGGYWLDASDGGIFAFNAPFYGSAGNLRLAKPVVGMAASPDSGGYYLDASDGGIFNYGDAHFQGSTGNIALARPVVGMAVDARTGGYWLVASDGGIFAFNAPFYGSAGNLRLAKPVVGMAATPSSLGYYLVASDGGIFTY